MTLARRFRVRAGKSQGEQRTVSESLPSRVRSRSREAVTVGGQVLLIGGASGVPDE